MSDDRFYSSGASLQANSLRDRWLAWRDNHRQVARDSLSRLFRKPFANGLTIGVMAIAMALPAGFALLAQNLEQLTGDVRDSVQMNVYLELDAGDSRGRAIVAELGGWAEIESVTYISRGEALQDFRRLSGYSEVLDTLSANPLPAVVVATLREERLTTEVASGLVIRAEALDKVTSAQVDMLWLQRAQALIGLVAQFSYGLGIVLGLGVLLVIGSTTRSAIEARREEIAVVRLVGATDAFIRRPFLYMGAWYGFCGALLALALLLVSKLVLTSSVGDILKLYEGQRELVGLDFLTFLLLPVAGVLLGWLGAMMASTYELLALEKQN